MKKPRVFILTAVHNNLGNVKKLLSDLKRQNYTNMSIYIVDDGSTDGTSIYVSTIYPKVNLITGDGKLWWTGSLFLGVKEILKKATKNDFILTINNDCTFAKDYISTLVRDGLKNTKTIVGSLIVDSKKRQNIWDGGVKVDWSGGGFYGIGPKNVNGIPKGKLYQKNIDTVSTKGTLYPVEVFKKIGSFDKKHLPHYLSDYEYGIRAKRNGFNLILSYRAKVSNDIKRTGIGDNIPEKFDIKYLFKLLFSRKSRVNIVDQCNLIHVACPQGYRLINYFLVIGKAVYYLLHVPPFTMVPRIVIKTKKILGIKHPIFNNSILRTKNPVRNS